MKKTALALILTLSILLISCQSTVPGTTTESELTSITTSTPTSPLPQTSPSVSSTPSITDTELPTPTPSGTPSVDFESSADFPQNIKNLKNSFQGEEIGIVMCGNSYATRSISPDGTEEVMGEVDTAVELRNKEVEKYLGVKIVAKETVNIQQMENYLKAQMSTPEADLDIVGINQYFDIGLAFGNSKNAFISYTELTNKGENNINLNAPYWSSDCYNTLDWKDNAFWLTGDLSLIWLSHTYVSFVNERIWNQYKDDIKELTGFESIYDVVKNGKWTLSLILELNERVHINNDGDESKVSYKDQHGLVLYSKNTSINNLVSDALFSACHVTITKYDATSKTAEPKMDYYNNNLKAYGQMVYDLYQNSKSCIIDFDSESEYGNVTKLFSAGNTLVTLGTLADGENYLSEMKDGYYTLPLPMLNQDQKAYSTTTVDTVNQFGISSMTKNASAATATLELLGYYTYKLVTPEYYNTVTRGRYSENGGVNSDSEMIDIIRNSVYYDFALLWTKDLGNVSWYMRNNFANKNLYQLARVQQATWESSLYDLIDKLNR